MAITHVLYGRAPVAARNKPRQHSGRTGRWTAAALVAVVASGIVCGQAQAAIGTSPTDAPWTLQPVVDASPTALAAGPGLMNLGGPGLVTFNACGSDGTELTRAFGPSAPTPAIAELSPLVPDQSPSVLALLSETPDPALREAVAFAARAVLNLHVLLESQNAMEVATLGLPRDATIELFFSAPPLLASGSYDILAPSRRAEFSL